MPVSKIKKKNENIVYPKVIINSKKIFSKKIIEEKIIKIILIFTIIFPAMKLNGIEKLIG